MYSCAYPVPVLWVVPKLGPWRSRMGLECRWVGLGWADASWNYKVRRIIMSNVPKESLSLKPMMILSVVVLSGWQTRPDAESRSNSASSSAWETSSRFGLASQLRWHSIRSSRAFSCVEGNIIQSKSPSRGSIIARKQREGEREWVNQVSALGWQDSRSCGKGGQYAFWLWECKCANMIKYSKGDQVQLTHLQEVDGTAAILCHWLAH